MDVSCVAFDPSGSATQISGSPERSDPNVTRRPSGDNWASSSSLVEEIAMTGGAVGPMPTAGVSIRQMFLSVKLRTYTSRDGLPGCSRDTTGITPYSPTKGKRVGTLSPATASLHRPPRAENRISLLSGIH